MIEKSERSRYLFYFCLMKPHHIILILTLCLASCSQPKKETSDNDLKLVAELGFDADLMSDIRQHTDSAFRKAEGSPDAVVTFKDSSNYVSFRKKNVNGLSFGAAQGKSLSIVNDLHDKFKSKGYIIYVSEGNFGYSPDEVTVLKTDDMFDVLRFEGTNGINYDIFTEDVIEKLKGWHDQFGLDIFAASFDLVEARYIRMPPDLKAHVDETYAFCPDVVDQGTGSVEALLEEVKKSKQLYLWWD